LTTAFVALALLLPVAAFAQAQPAPAPAGGLLKAPVPQAGQVQAPQLPVQPQPGLPLPPTPQNAASGPGSHFMRWRLVDVPQPAAAALSTYRNQMVEQVRRNDVGWTAGSSGAPAGGGGPLAGVAGQANASNPVIATEQAVFVGVEFEFRLTPNAVAALNFEPQRDGDPAAVPGRGGARLLGGFCLEQLTGNRPCPAVRATGGDAARFTRYFLAVKFWETAGMTALSTPATVRGSVRLNDADTGRILLAAASEIEVSLAPAGRAQVRLIGVDQNMGQDVTVARSPVAPPPAAGSAGAGPQAGGLRPPPPAQTATAATCTPQDPQGRAWAIYSVEFREPAVELRPALEAAREERIRQARRIPTVAEYYRSARVFEVSVVYSNTSGSGTLGDSLNITAYRDGRSISWATTADVSPEERVLQATRVRSGRCLVHRAYIYMPVGAALPSDAVEATLHDVRRAPGQRSESTPVASARWLLRRQGDLPVVVQP
jgi:hypothetical protein